MAKSKSRKSNRKSFSRKKKYVSTRKSRTKKRKNLSLNKYQKGGSKPEPKVAQKAPNIPVIKIFDSYGNELRYYDGNKYQLHLALHNSNDALHKSICEEIQNKLYSKGEYFIESNCVVFTSKRVQTQAKNKYLHECITIFNVLKGKMVPKVEKNYRLDIIFNKKNNHFSYSLGRELTKKNDAEQDFIHKNLMPYRIEYKGKNNYHLIVNPSP